VAGRQRPCTGMSTAIAEPAPARAGYQHEAFLYRSEAEFLAGTVPFIRAGLTADEPVLVAVVKPRLDLIAAALGADADRVALVDMAVLGANPARIIPAWRRFVTDHDADLRPVRGIGEPIWAGRSPAELVECQLHEALLNVAVGEQTQLRLRCPYDAAALAPTVVAEARRSHPVVAGPTRPAGGAQYGGTDHVARLFGAPLPEPPTVPWTFRFDRVSLQAVRTLVADHAAAAGLAVARAAEFTLAAHEVASNSVRHGGGRGTLRIWRDGTAIVCEITDPGHIGDPLVGRVLAAGRAEGGRGLWLANHLCDLVQVRSSATNGTTVRIHSRI
jgi:anti-sigma regulatory factor (Ser/Thr protein kinase)